MTTAIASTAVDGHTRAIEMDPAAGRFTIRNGGEVAFLTFHLRGRTMSLLHTEIPPMLRGKKVGITLARSAIEYARDHGLRIKPYCPFVAGYVKRHPEYQHLVAK
jgi:predicted GNAT family acetyltransferase